MKSFVLMDSKNMENELPIIKERVKNGETIYTVIDGDTVFIEYNEIDNIYKKKIVDMQEILYIFNLLPANEVVINPEVEQEYKYEINENTIVNAIIKNENECIENIQPKVVDNPINNESQNFEEIKLIKERLDTIEKALSNPFIILPKTI